MAIRGIGVQTKEAIDDACPEDGFRILKEAGFSHVDFSLNKYMSNKDIYQMKNSHFFDKPIEALKEYFRPHKEAAAKYGITIGQMHMPYFAYVPWARLNLMITCGMRWHLKVCSCVIIWSVLILLFMASSWLIF